MKTWKKIKMITIMTVRTMQKMKVAVTKMQQASVMKRTTKKKMVMTAVMIVMKIAIPSLIMKMMTM